MPYVQLENRINAAQETPVSKEQSDRQINQFLRGAGNNIIKAYLLAGTALISLRHQHAPYQFSLGVMSNFLERIQSTSVSKSLEYLDKETRGFTTDTRVDHVAPMLRPVPIEKATIKNLTKTLRQLGYVDEQMQLRENVNPYQVIAFLGKQIELAQFLRRQNPPLSLQEFLGKPNLTTTEDDIVSVRWKVIEKLTHLASKADFTGIDRTVLAHEIGLSERQIKANGLHHGIEELVDKGVITLFGQDRNKMKIKLNDTYLPFFKDYTKTMRGIGESKEEAISNGINSFVKHANGARSSFTARRLLDVALERKDISRSANFPPLVLFLSTDKEIAGAVLQRRMETALGRYIELSTFYTLLDRMEAKGIVSSREVRRGADRKLYRLVDEESQSVFSKLDIGKLLPEATRQVLAYLQKFVADNGEKDSLLGNYLKMKGFFFYNEGESIFEICRYIGGQRIILRSDLENIQYTTIDEEGERVEQSSFEGVIGQLGESDQALVTTLLRRVLAYVLSP